MRIVYNNPTRAVASIVAFLLIGLVTLLFDSSQLSSYGVSVANVPPVEYLRLNEPSEDHTENDGTLDSGSSGVRFKGDKIRTYLPKSDSSLLPPAHTLPLFDQLFGGKVKECYQWAVVTTIHVPNESIIGVSNMRNWCLVIIGDNITPDNAYDDLAKKNNVFYLSASNQKKFFLGTTTATNGFIKMMPFNSFARKNIGYLFAVNFGARVVFDFDDDNVLSPLEDGVTVPPPFLYRKEVDFDSTVLLEFVESEQSSALAFNPYEFMRASHKESWPRGFPVDHLQKNFENWGEQNTTVGDIKYSSIGVIQSLCDGDPDNDAIFRMTRPDSTKFTFSRTATSLPLLIPYSAYSPYNAQATTHLYSAFWGLYLPITVPGRVTDIWRSYITQRIMKDIGLHVMYTPPIVKHERSAHDYLADFAAESDLYSKTAELLKFLDSWSSTANTLPERISDLWIALYERDYIRLDDVEAVKEWLRVLQEVGYKYPDVNGVSTRKCWWCRRRGRQSTTAPQIQPTLDGQPYRSFPFFNGHVRPGSAVLKIIMMTMDEWPLLKSWVVYHGDMLGFENLYILDSSTDARCVSFLRYARDILGANVIFSDANLNQLGDIIESIAKDISGSSDLIMKMDTDEFLVLHDSSTNSFTASFPSFLSGFANNQEHPLRLNGDSRIGYVQNSVPSEEVCKKNIYSTPEKFGLDDLHFIGTGPFEYFKGVFDSRQPFNEGRKVGLGGHAFKTRKGVWTEIGLIHYHRRCAEIEAENCKRVLERHDYIDPSAVDSKDVLDILIKKLNCTSTPEDFCSTCTEPNSVLFTSQHKALPYGRWLSCPEKFKKEYYPAGGGKGIFNSDLEKAMKKSHAKFDL